MRSLAGPAVVLALLVSLFSAVGLTEHASAAELDEIGAAEGRETPSQPVSTDTICSALAAAAAQNDLPTDFFARLIWQESRFDPTAVSRAGFFLGQLSLSARSGHQATGGGVSIGREGPIAANRRPILL